MGWLDPTGTFFECEWGVHLHIANELVKIYNYQNPNNLPNDDLLLSNGWVHITISIIGNREWSIFWEKRLTDYQKNFLKPYFEESDIPPNFGSIYKWESEL